MGGIAELLVVAEGTVVDDVDGREGACKVPVIEASGT